MSTDTPMEAPTAPAGPADAAESDWQALKKKGNDFYRAGDVEAAIGAYTEALESAPEEFTLYSNRAAAHLKLNDNKAAIDDCRKCVEINPLFVKGWLRLATALRNLGSLREALEAANQGVSVSDPSEAKSGANEIRKLAMKLDRELHRDDDEVERRMKRSNGGGVESLAAEYNALYTSVQRTNNALKTKTSTLRQLGATRARVDRLSQADKCYVTVGRAFIYSPLNTIQSEMDSETAIIRADVDRLVSKMKSNEKRLTDVKREIEEIMRSRGA